jgi:HSP20 family protein
METRSIWHPWHEMHRLQREMEQLLGDLAPAWRWPLTGDYPPVNIVRQEGSLTLEALCPGAERDTLDVTVVGDAVTLRCERKPPADVPAERYQRRERPVGTFTRTIAVGERFDPDRTQATYTNGILRVELARAAESAPKKIQIQS